MAAIGLQTHIWNNNLKSMLLLAGFPFLLLLMLFATGLLSTGNVDLGVSFVKNSWPLALGGATILFLIAWMFHGSMINAASGARPLSRQENPRVYNLLENLCISRGMVMPTLQLIETPALNAFASGINEKSYAISVTTGLLDALNDAELEAVLAHELTHIINRDVRLLIIAVIFVGMISFISEMIWRSMRFTRTGGRRDVRIVIVAALVLLVGYLFAIVIRFAISRKREFMADAGAVELTKNPDAMVSALMKISGRAKMEMMPDEVAQMCIENPPGMFSLFATHPPIDARIRALVEVAGARIDPETVTMKDPTAGKTSIPWETKPAPFKRSPWGPRQNNDSGTV